MEVVPTFVFIHLWRIIGLNREMEKKKQEAKCHMKLEPVFEISKLRAMIVV